MTDDVRPLNAEMTHQGAKCRRFALERQRAREPAAARVPPRDGTGSGNDGR
jgi:hypothetical protein